MKTKYMRNHIRNIHKNTLSRIYRLIVAFSVLLLLTTSFAETNKTIDTYYDHALILLQKGLYADAEAVLSAGIAKYPKATKLYYERGNLYNEVLQQYVEAVKDYNSVIRLDLKNYPKVLWRRGDCLYAIGKYQQAIKDYTQCLSLLPKYDKVHMKRAKAYAKMGMIDKAKSDLQSAAKYGPGYEREARALLEKMLSGSNDF
jgi:tetratricopeptide (TPR) repeat protein